MAPPDFELVSEKLQLWYPWLPLQRIYFYFFNKFPNLYFSFAVNKLNNKIKIRTLSIKKYLNIAQSTLNNFILFYINVVWNQVSSKRAYTEKGSVKKIQPINITFWYLCYSENRHLASSFHKCVISSGKIKKKINGR